MYTRPLTIQSHSKEEVHINFHILLNLLCLHIFLHLQNVKYILDLQNVKYINDLRMDYNITEVPLTKKEGN